MGQQVVVLVGTVKGAFFYYSDARRRDWRMTGPHLAGWEIYSLLGDSRHGNRVFAGTNHYVYGGTIRVSDDFGENWTQIEAGPSYSKESGFHLNRIWQIVPGHASEPNTLYAGVEEAGLFKSEDRSTTWREISSLTAHPTRPGWAPGNGGLCLHTILVDPTNRKRIWVGASAVGVFRTDDGGETWRVCNEGLPGLVTGEDYPEIGRCVHKMVLDPNDPNTLYMQYHGGVMRSTDGASSWHPIETGLPSNFGFPMCVSARGDLFVIPLSDERYLIDGKLCVYRSRDRGESWHALSKGLAEQPHYVGVLRDAMAADPLDPAGIYFATSMGEVFASPDAGESWLRLPGQLPRVTTVKTWLVER